MKKKLDSLYIIAERRGEALALGKEGEKFWVIIDGGMLEYWIPLTKKQAQEMLKALVEMLAEDIRPA